MRPTQYGGEVEIVMLAQLKQVAIAVVSTESLTVLTYGPSQWVNDHDVSPSGERPRIMLLYNGRHYDTLVGRDGRFIFGGRYGGTEAAATVDGWALTLATELKARRDLELRTRTRKRLRCGGEHGCGAILIDTAALQVHGT